MSLSIRNAISRVIAGAKGGGSQHTPVEAPDSLKSTALAQILDLVSEGEIRGLVNGLQSIYFDETPVANADGSLNFKNVQIDFRPGTQDQTHIQGFPDVESETAIGVELKSDTPWVRTFTNTDLSALGVRIAVDALSKANTSNGDINGNTIQYSIDISVDGGPFNTAISAALTGKTSSRYERTHRIDVPEGASSYTMRVRRTTPNANSASVADVTRIVSVTEIIDAKLRYPNSAVVGSQLSAEQFSNIPTRSFDLYGRIIRVPGNYDPATRTYTGIWDGTFKPAWTDNPAWVFYDIVTHPRYGLGQLVSTELVDKWALYKIAQYCDGLVPDGKGGMEPRFTCNVYLQTRADAYKVLQDLASVFRGLSYWAGGSIVASADMPQDPVYLYNTSNVIEGRFTYQGSARKQRHTVALVSWNDMSDFGRAKVEYVEDQEGIERYGVQQIEVTAVGCTSRAQARRVGKWILLTERYETDTITFSVGLDGAIASPGQIIRVADPLRAGRRIGGRISQATYTTISVDALPTVKAGDTISCVLPDATVEKRMVSGVVGNVITVSQNFSQIPQQQSAWVVESSDLQAQLYRVVSVSENDGLTFTITALEHNPGKFDEVELGIKHEEPNITSLPSKVQLAPTNIVIEHTEIAGEVTAGTAVTIHWDPVAGACAYEIEWRQGYASWKNEGRTTGTSYDIYGVMPGPFEVRITALNSLGERSTPASAPPYNVPDQTTPPKVVGRIQDQSNQNSADIAQEINDRIAAVSAEAAARAADLVAEANARAAAIKTAIDKEVADRTDAIAAEAQARADAVLNEQLARESAITTEQNLRQTADESLAQQISTLVAGTGEQFDSKQVWYFDTDLESWTGNGAPTIETGFLRPADSADDPYIVSPAGLGIDGTAYRYVKVRLKRVGTPVWEGGLSWRLEGDAPGAWRSPVTAAEPAWDTVHGDATVDFKDVEFGGVVDQIRLDLTAGQSSANYVMVDWVALGRPTPGASTAALQEESLARISGDAAEATARQTLAAQMRGNYEGTDSAQLTQGLLYSEQQARVTADSALAQDISSLQAKVDDNTASITSEAAARADGDSANASKIDQLTSRVETAEASLVNELITRATKDAVVIDQMNVMEGRMTDAEQTVQAAASTVSGYETRLENAEGSITSQSSQITSLNNSLTSLTGDVSATNSSVSDLTSRVTKNEGSITAQGSRLDSLESSVSDAKTNINANASAVSALTTRVSNAEGNITSQSSSITSISSRVTTAEGKITANANAVTSLQTSVNATSGKVNASYTLKLDANGRVVGFIFQNDGTSGDFAISADKFSIVSPTGTGARTEYSNGNWRVYDANGVLRVALGVNI